MSDISQYCPNCEAQSSELAKANALLAELRDAVINGRENATSLITRIDAHLEQRT